MSTRRRRRRRKTQHGALLAALVVLALVAVANAHSAAATGRGAVVVGLVLAAVAARFVIRRRAKAARLATARSLEQLRGLSPAAFEATTAEVLGLHGWHLRVNGGAGDEGADLVGSDPNGRRVIVQCKRYSAGRLVGSPVVQLAIGARSIYQAERVLVVTTSGFTEPARKLADREGVELIDGPALVHLASPPATPRLVR